MIDHLILGFSEILSLNNLLICLAGCLLGTIIGVLPGVGTVATLSMLLPILYGMDPVTSIIGLAGIYYGAQYGGSTTSILLNTPGEPSSIVTCIDGHAMAKNGLGGNAIFIAGISSFIAGIFVLVVMAVLGPFLSNVAFLFGPQEYFLMMLTGIFGVSLVGTKNIFVGFSVGVVGILLGFIGTDVNTGMTRFTGKVYELYDGIPIGVIAIGLFGIAELLQNTLHPPEQNFFREQTKIVITKDQFKRTIPPAFRGTLIGTIMGLLPGGGAVLSSFVSYMIEKKVGKNKEQMGKGALEGVAAPEAANNASAQMSFIPLLALGIPENVVMSLILASLVITGIQPGPNVINEQPGLFWGLICSMFIGNFFLLLLNVPMARIWMNLLKTPRWLLYPALFAFSFYGVYSINNSYFDVGLSLLFGVIGYLMPKIGVEPAPLILGAIFGPMMEEYFRRSMLLVQGDLTTFVHRPLSLAMLTVMLVMILYSFKKIRQKT